MCAFGEFATGVPQQGVEDTGLSRVVGVVLGAVGGFDAYELAVVGFKRGVGQL